MVTTRFLIKGHINGCCSTNTEWIRMLNISAKSLTVISICSSHAEVEDFLDIFLLWFMEVLNYEMSLQRHLQFGHGNVNLLIQQHPWFPKWLKQSFHLWLFLSFTDRTRIIRNQTQLVGQKPGRKWRLLNGWYFLKGFPSANCRR